MNASDYGSSNKILSREFIEIENFKYAEGFFSDGSIFFLVMYALLYSTNKFSVQFPHEKQSKFLDQYNIGFEQVERQDFLTSEISCSIIFFF